MLTQRGVPATFDYIDQMTAKRIQIGQVWKKVGTEETFLVTKLYNEALATIAVLRPTGAATESLIRVRVDRRGDDQPCRDILWRKSTKASSEVGPPNPPRLTALAG
jgi:hypothetical protein